MQAGTTLLDVLADGRIRRQRLHQLLSADLQPRIGDLTAKQLVALRFACDAELPELVRDVVAGKLSTSKDIKLKIKSWQGDFLRA